MHKAQRLINHIALVLDGSYSMSSHKANLIKVADEQIKHLALKSEELSQETRVSVYLFDDTVQCLIFDMDVMRLPSIRDLYRIGGRTALVDSVVQSQDDLATTSQIYGDHAFLTFVLTDGQENQSRNSWTVLPKYTSGAGVNWSIGFLVPDEMGTAYMDRMGVGASYVSVWDKNSAKGLEDSFNVIRNATDSYMTARASGVRGTRSVFSTGADAVNRQSVAQLAPLNNNSYELLPVGAKVRIDDFLKSNYGYYNAGMGYYQLTKTEKIQPQKSIIVVEKGTGKAFGGSDARKLIGLPDTHTRVKPDYNPAYDIYVQSTSWNRNLMPKTKVLVKK